jgi:actin-related protein
MQGKQIFSIICENELKDFNSENELNERSLRMDYVLPDERVITVQGQRYQAPEILFQPSLIGMEHYGVNELIEDRLVFCIFFTDTCHQYSKLQQRLQKAILRKYLSERR